MAATTKGGTGHGGKRDDAAGAKGGTKKADGAAARGPTARKDPEGGLTAAGRAFYARTEGARLRPGVTKRDADMSPEDMKRKGSFLRRHFANPRGPMLDDGGKPTRLALSAQAWGEKPPKDADGARKLADKGSRYLEKYHAAKAKADAGDGAGKAANATKATKAAKTTKTAGAARTNAAAKGSGREKRA